MPTNASKPTARSTKAAAKRPPKRSKVRQPRKAGVPRTDNNSYELRLYVAGQTRKSLQSIANLKRICEEYLPGRYSIEVVDLIEHPHLARGDQILAIPTLVRKLPEPIRKIIGDLSHVEKVLLGLDVKPGAAPDGK